MARVNTSKNKVTYVAIIVSVLFCTLGVGTLGYKVWNKNPTPAPIVLSQEEKPRQKKPKQTPPPINQTLPLNVQRRIQPGDDIENPQMEMTAKPTTIPLSKDCTLSIEDAKVIMRPELNASKVTHVKTNGMSNSNTTLTYQQANPNALQGLPLSELPEQPNNGTIFDDEHSIKLIDDNDVSKNTGEDNVTPEAEPTTPTQNIEILNTVQRNTKEIPKSTNESCEDQDTLDPILLKPFTEYINQNEETIENLINKVEKGSSFKKVKKFNQEKVLKPEIDLELAVEITKNNCLVLRSTYSNRKFLRKLAKKYQATGIQNLELDKKNNADINKKLEEARNLFKKELIKQCKIQFEELYEEIDLYNYALDTFVAMIKDDVYTDNFSTKNLTKQQWINETKEFIIELHPEVIRAINQVDYYQSEVNMIDDDKPEKTEAIKDAEETLNKYREAVNNSIEIKIKEVEGKSL